MKGGRKMKKCYIVGGGDFCADLFRADENAVIIAADAGYKALEEIGITPQIVVGDFDSLGYTPEHPDVEAHSPIKDDTDMMLAVEKGIELGCDEFYIYGATGGRLAHTMGNMQVLCYIAEKGFAGYIFDRDTLITAVNNRTLLFDKNASGYISLMPFGCGKASVTLSGFKYDVDGCDLPFNRPLGISNEFTGRAARLTVHSGTVIAVWENTDVLPVKEVSE